jgi:hypothetical protein
MTKTELEAKIEALQAALNTKSQEQNAYQSQIDTLKKELEDINKPKLTPAQFDKMYTAIEMGLETFDFDDVDNYSIDYGIDYDNRVTCESFCFDNVSEVAQEIYNHLEVLFAEAKCPDEDNNQEK